MIQLHGRLDTPWLESEVLKGNLPCDPTTRMVPVYLPPGYETSDRRYPVIYVLSGHGSSGPHMLNSPPWGESFPERLDRLCRERCDFDPIELAAQVDEQMADHAPPAAGETPLADRLRSAAIPVG